LGVEYCAYERPGLSAAINEVWQAYGAGADYFAWLGDDDVLSPISVFASTEHLDRHRECVAVYGRIRIIRADGSTVVTMRPGRLALLRRPLSIVGRVYSSIVRRMPPGTTAQHAGHDYVRAGPEEPAREGSRPDAPSTVPAWKAAAIGMESVVVRTAVRVWDAT